jgi:hypothetical protein
MTLHHLHLQSSVLDMFDFLRGPGTRSLYLLPIALLILFATCCGVAECLVAFVMLRVGYTRLMSANQSTVL